MEWFCPLRLSVFSQISWINIFIHAIKSYFKTTKEGLTPWSFWLRAPPTPHLPIEPLRGGQDKQQVWVCPASASSPDVTGVSSQLEGSTWPRTKAPRGQDLWGHDLRHLELCLAPVNLPNTSDNLKQRTEEVGKQERSLPGSTSLFGWVLASFQPNDLLKHSLSPQ